MSTHTPGPWTEIHGKHIRASNGYLIAQIDAPFHMLNEITTADARLIAAAPDLLEALKELADTSRAYLAHMDAKDIAALESARAAIAKAEGVS